MMDRFRQARDQQVELNLTPVMNLFVAMIPFLLMCASFYSVSVVNASQPIADPGGGSDLAKGEDKVTLAVEVRRGVGYKVTAQSDTLPEAVLDRITVELPKLGVRYDTESLTQIAEDVKGRYPKSDTAMLLCDNDVFYADLIATMDALRERVERKGAEDIHHALFPVIVVSTVSGSNAGTTPGGAAAGAGEEGAP